MFLGTAVIFKPPEDSMATSTFVNHKGAHLVQPEELALIKAPPPTDTWFPIAHSDVLGNVRNALIGAGYEIQRQQLSVAHDGHRFFGTLDLSTRINDGSSLAVGIRNSTDKSFPIGWCCGQRVFVCDNLAFTSEIVIAKKHTRFGQERYLEALSNAVASLPSYQKSASAWAESLQHWELSRQEADSLILRSYELGLIGPRLLPDLIKGWRNPEHDEFRAPTGWSLWNAFTAVLRKRQEMHPAEAALTTIRLQKLLTPEIIDVEFDKVQAV
jgi:hypothetical protein